MFDIASKVEQFAGNLKDRFIADLGIAHADLSNALVALAAKRNALVTEAFDTIKNDEPALSARLAEIRASVDAEANAAITQADQAAAAIKAKLYNGFEGVHSKFEEILRILKA